MKWSANQDFDTWSILFREKPLLYGTSLASIISKTSETSVSSWLKKGFIQTSGTNLTDLLQPYALPRIGWVTQCIHGIAIYQSTTEWDFEFISILQTFRTTSSTPSCAMLLLRILRWPSR